MRLEGIIGQGTRLLAKEVIVNWFHLKACVKCGGDLVLDEGDWRCLQCGSYYYIGLYREGQPMKWRRLQPNSGKATASSADLTGKPVYPIRGELALLRIPRRGAEPQAKPQGPSRW